MKAKKNKESIGSEYKEDIDSSKMISDYARHCYSTQLNNFEELDSKAASLAGVAWIVITIVSFFSGEIFKSNFNGSCLFILFNSLTQIIYLVLILLIFVASVFFVSSMRVRKFVDILEVKKLIDDYKKMGDIKERNRKLAKYIAKVYGKSEASLRESNKLKAKLIVKGTYFLLISLFLSFFGVLFFVLKKISNWR